MADADTVTSPPRVKPEFKATAGYAVVETDWDPGRDPCGAWGLQSLKGAQARRRAFREMNPRSNKVIVCVETTYTVVDGDDD